MGELVSAVLAWEGEMEEDGERAGQGRQDPADLEMAAMLKLCPKEIQATVELRWGEIGEEYEKLKDRVIGWATTKAEKRGGPVPMEGDGLAWEDEEEAW